MSFYAKKKKKRNWIRTKLSEDVYYMCRYVNLFGFQTGLFILIRSPRAQFINHAFEVRNHNLGNLLLSAVFSLDFFAV